MTTPTPTELTTLIAEARKAANEGVLDHPDPTTLFANLADALESLSATTPTEWEWAWGADLPDGSLWTGDRDPRHQYSWGTSFLDWGKERSASVLPTVRRVHRTPAGPWISEGETPVTPTEQLTPPDGMWGTYESRLSLLGLSDKPERVLLVNEEDGGWLFWLPESWPAEDWRGDTRWFKQEGARFTPTKETP